MIDRPDDRTDATDPTGLADSPDRNTLDGDDFTEEMSDGEAEADETSGATHGGRVADA